MKIPEEEVSEKPEAKVEEGKEEKKEEVPDDMSSDIGDVERRSWNNYGEELDPSQQCPKCVVGRGFTYCELHGDKYIDYKCIFCCQIALFNCGGNYFYCSHHHGDGGEHGGDCKGVVEDCPLGIEHLPNLPHEKNDDIFKDPHPKGFGLGCSVCREIKESGNEKKKRKVLEAEQKILDK